jgi:hypothetical protein
MLAGAKLQMSTTLVQTKAYNLLVSNTLLIQLWSLYKEILSENSFTWKWLFFSGGGESKQMPRRQ